MKASEESAPKRTAKQRPRKEDGLDLHTNRTAMMAAALKKEFGTDFCNVIVDPDAPLKTATDWITMPGWFTELTNVPGMAAGHISIIQGKPDTGKCLRINTPVLQHDGTVALVQDIKPGDKLMGPDGKPRTVGFVNSGTEEMFTVVPNYGEEWGCNRSHILSLKCNFSAGAKWQKNKIYNISVAEYLDLPECAKARLKLWRTGVEFPVAEDLPWDPYWVGLWLGDGTRGTTKIHKDEPELDSYFEEFAACTELIYRRIVYQDVAGVDKCPAHTFTTTRGQPNPLLSWVVANLEVGDTKRIPTSYLTASRTDRMSLLAGLLDTDGFQDGSGFEIATKFPGLRDDILFLARSLGLRATYVEKVSQIKSRNFTGIYQRIYISGGCHEIPCLLPRRQAPIRRDPRDHLVSGFELRSDGSGTYYGFTLLEDPLFLLGDFTVTHNTSLAMEAMIQAQKLGWYVVLIDSEFKFNFDRFKSMGGDVTQVMHVEAPTLEVCFDRMEKSIDRMRVRDPEARILFLWDSLGFTPTQQEMDGGSAGQAPAAAARVIKRNLRRLMSKIHSQRVCVLVVNHVYSKIGVISFGDTTVGYGGGGAYYAAVMVIEVKKIGTLRRQINGEKFEYLRVQLKLRKNHLSGNQGTTRVVNVMPGGIETIATSRVSKVDDGDEVVPDEDVPRPKYSRAQDTDGSEDAMAEGMD